MSDPGGAQAPGQHPFPNQPPADGQPPAPGQPPADGQPPAPGQPSVAGRRAGRPLRTVVWIVVIVVVLGGIAAVSWYLRQDDAQNAAVGDCLRSDGDDLAIVECSDAEAKFTVVGKVDNATQIQAGISSCSKYEGVTQSYWRGEEGGKGIVLCLAPAPR